MTNSKTYTAEEMARLNATHGKLMTRLQNLPEKHQRTVLIATANPGLRDGRDAPDPYAQAIAKQMLDAYEVSDRVASAQKELADIGKLDLSARYPIDPDYPTRMRARKVELEEAIERDSARMIGVAEQSLEYAKREAVASYRKEAETARKSAALGEAIARAEVAAETAELDRRAAQIVSGRGTVNGRDFD